MTCLFRIRTGNQSFHRMLSGESRQNRHRSCEHPSTRGPGFRWTPNRSRLTISSDQKMAMIRAFAQSPSSESWQKPLHWPIRIGEVTRCMRLAHIHKSTAMHATNQLNGTLTHEDDVL